MAKVNGPFTLPVEAMHDLRKIVMRNDATAYTFTTYKTETTEHKSETSDNLSAKIQIDTTPCADNINYDVYAVLEIEAHIDNQIFVKYAEHRLKRSILAQIQDPIAFQTAFEKFAMILDMLHLPHDQALVVGRALIDLKNAVEIK